MHIKRIRVQNFRNFADFDVELWRNVVVVGENNSGKSNLLHALRLALDPTLPNSARFLESSDFWDGLEKPFAGHEIRITVTFADFESKEAEHAAIPKCFGDDGSTSSVTYVFGPARNRDYPDPAQ
ncbi:MAG: AAA family ATPase, partial [Anaerolineae bacterium]|nr:AAA family ATPase [Anaerolineae bacterium]